MIVTFLEEQILDSNKEVKAADLYFAYKIWSIARDGKFVGTTKFYNVVELRFKRERRQDGFYFLGLSLRNKK